MILWLGVSIALLSASIPQDTFIYNSYSEPETLDPHRVVAASDWNLSYQMFETLIGHENDFALLKPGLAEKWGISSDGRIYTFTIRKNLAWSNGEPITLSQIRGSLLRAMDPSVGNRSIEWYTNTIEGAEEYVNSFKKASQRVESDKKLGIRELPPNQIQIKLKQPVGSFLKMVSNLPFAIIHPKMYSLDPKIWTNPSHFIVNGPYQLNSWLVNRKLTLFKNKKYWDQKNVKFEKIEALIIPDTATTLRSFQTGEMDWTGSLKIPSNLVSSLQLKREFQSTNEFSTMILFFNLAKPPLDDRRVREALSLSLDTHQICKAFLKGGEVEAVGVVPPGIPGYDYQFKNDLPFLDRVSKAKDLLKKSGYDDVSKFPKLEILYSTDDQSKRILEVIQQMWKKNLGISVSLLNQEMKVYLKSRNEKHYLMGLRRILGDFPDPLNILSMFQTHDSGNHLNWSNVSFDEAVKRASKMVEESSRLKESKKAERILLEDFAVIPLFHNANTSLISSKVLGFKPNSLNVYRFSYLSKN